MEFFLTIVSERAFSLWIALALTILLGWPFSYLLKLDRVSHSLNKLARLLLTRLNRRRDAATRAWRGVIATFMIALPAMLLGALIDRQLQGGLMWLSPLLLFTASQRAPGMLALWRAAKADTLTLQMAKPHYIFADTFSLLRFMILDHATRFAVQVVGVIVWYLLLGSAGAFFYLAMALCAAHFSPEREANIAFGGATAALFNALDALPRALTKVLLLFAGLFVPSAHPFNAIRQFRSWPLLLATLLGISLGGPMPAAHGGATMPWVGSGTPKPDARHLGSWLLIWAVALIVLLAVTLPLLIQLKP